MSAANGNSLDSLVRQESATDFMLRKATTWDEWLTIGEPRTMARIRECIRRYPKPYARHALRTTCMSNAEAHGRRSRTVQPLVGSLDGDHAND